MTGTLLSADDPRIDFLVAHWDRWDVSDYPLPGWRSRWLGQAEVILRELHPTANSDSLTLTARTLAPFPLQKPGVP